MWEWEHKAPGDIRSLWDGENGDDWAWGKGVGSMIREKKARLMRKKGKEVIILGESTNVLPE